MSAYVDATGQLMWGTVCRPTTPADAAMARRWLDEEPCTRHYWHHEQQGGCVYCAICGTHKVQRCAA